MFGTKVYSRPKEAPPAKPNISHEVTAARAGRPTGRPNTFF